VLNSLPGKGNESKEKCCKGLQLTNVAVPNIIFLVVLNGLPGKSNESKEKCCKALLRPKT
jgi:hypothetical protein